MLCALERRVHMPQSLFGESMPRTYAPYASEPAAMPACAGLQTAWQRQVCKLDKCSLQSRALQYMTMIQSSCWHHGLPVHYPQRSSRRLLMCSASVLWHGTTSSSHGCGTGCASPSLAGVPAVYVSTRSSSVLFPNRCGCRILSTTNTSGLSSTACLILDRRRRC